MPRKRKSNVRYWIIWLCVSAFIVASGSVLNAATPVPTTRNSDDVVELNFPENVELRVLVDYVGRRCGINFLYDEQAVAQRITLRTSVKVPTSSLLGLLESALKSKNLALIEGDQPGWMKIVPAANFPASVRPAIQPDSVRSTQVIAQVFPLRYIEAAKAEQAVKPFLSQPGGNTLGLGEAKLLVVTDYANGVAKAAEILKLIDQPSKVADVRFLPVKNIDAAALAPQITQILNAKTRGRASGGAVADTVDVSAEPRTNQLVVVGPAERIGEVEDVLRALDVPLPLETRTYALRSASPERLDRLAKELSGPDAKRQYQSAIDREGNRLIVTSTVAIHDKVEALRKDIDQPIAQEQSPVRFYKLMNTTASEVIATLGAVEGAEGMTEIAVEGGVPHQPHGDPIAGTNNPPAAVGQQAPAPPIYHSSGQSSLGNSSGIGSAGGAGSFGGTNQANQGGWSSASNNQAVRSLKTKNGTITADPNTNTLIVVADPASQRIYEQLIRALDKRRPQVLIECTLVTMDTSDNFSFGVEVGGGGNSKNGQWINFSSFGLSTVNSKTGQLAITPGQGFNSAILSSDVFSAVLRALSTNSRSKVMSAPRILVNDNATGTLASVAESPFTSVNASNTVSTTSFAGYASAGTTIDVTPHISEGDHLQLEYTVQLNSFTGDGGAGIPPPRQTDSVTSKITIPDGQTVVVGGLNRHNYSFSKSGIPILGDIPVLQYLFSSRNSGSSDSTLFVFIRPVVLRDDQFEDLKYYSTRDTALAGVKSDYPSSKPLPLR